MRYEQELLQKQYDLTMGQTDPWYFFLHLTDYIKFVNGTTPFKDIIEPLKKQKGVLIEQLSKEEQRAIDELLASKKKLEKLVSKVKGLPETIKKEGFFSDGFTSIDMYMEGKMHTSGIPSDVISRYLYEISWSISGNGQEKLLDEFTVSHRGTERLVAFSDALKKRQELTTELDTQRSLSPWGCWDFLSIASDESIFIWPSWTSQFSKVDQTYLSEYVSVKHEIQENKPPENTFPRTQRQRNSSRESRVPTYKHYLERMHLYLLKEANQFYSQSKPELEKKKVVLYLSENGDLYKDVKRKYQMGQASDRYKIIKFLSENIGYHTTDEISGKLGNKNKQTLRTEIGKIKSNANTKLGFKDLIEGKKQSGYRINPKYKISARKE
jgi:hypothetical protein